MTPLRILYLGTRSGTCLDRASAYRRLGHDVHHVDPRSILPASIWVDRLSWRLGGELFAPLLRRGLARALDNRTYDLCHVDSGQWVTSGVIGLLREHAPRVINYNIDDPTGTRDGWRFRAYRKALHAYDLAVVIREINVVEARALGARHVMRVYMSADEVAHAPRKLDDDDRRRWNSQVLFVGTWMPERGPFLLELVRRGVPLSIQGDHWQKAPEWPHLAAYWRGPAIYGDEYAKALQCARINLGLLSKGNRDLHTTRSLEIPALGALLCAQRTSEHVAMYDEGKEAMFWSDAEECARVCLDLLDNEPARQRIEAAGSSRAKRNGYFNEIVLANIVNAALERASQASAPSIARNIAAA